MQHAEFLGTQGPGGLAGFDQRLDQSGRIPLGGHHIVPFALEPVLEKLPLGGLAGAVGTFKGDQQSALLFAGDDDVAEVSGRLARRQCG